MLAETIKKKLKDGEVVFTSWMSIGHPSIGEIFAGSGVDCVVVDLEHTAIDNSEVLRMLMGIDCKGAVPLVRLIGNDKSQAKAVLDSGAAGILVPMVNTREEAEQVVSMAKYPPLGTRSVGLARAHQYGASFEEYVEAANDKVLVVVQIEHIDAVESIDEILSVPGIDVAFIGPYDLSMSMGLPGKIDHPDVQEAMEKVRAGAVRHGVAPGIHLVYPSYVKLRIEETIKKGYQFIAIGSDLVILEEISRDLNSVIRGL